VRVRGAATPGLGMPSLRSFGRQSAAHLRPARSHRLRIEPQTGAAAAAQADATELVGVLVDEADTDAVVGRDAAGRPQLWHRTGVRRRDEAGELGAKPERHTVCDLVGERRDRILRLVEAFDRHQVLGRVRWAVVARIVSDRRPNVGFCADLSNVNHYYPCMQTSEMRYTSAMLARLTYSHAAYELSERLVSEVGTHADGYGRGAFLAEEARTIESQAIALLEAAVAADRLRGASWLAVADALELSADAAEERFASAERQFREGLLFPHRYPEHGGLGYTAAPYAVEEPDRVRKQLDAWVVERHGSSGPDRDEPQSVSRGLAAMADRWISERIGQVLELSDALIKGEFPDGVSYKDAELRHAEMKVELFDAMSRDGAGSRELDHALDDARARLAELLRCASPVESRQPE
jgi:hypothetical protein